MKGKRHIILASDGTLCPRCNSEAEVRAHKQIGAKQLAQPFYYSRWYQCNNKLCQTTTFMKEKWKVLNKNAAAQALQYLEEREEQLSFLRQI